MDVATEKETRRGSVPGAHDLMPLGACRVTATAERAEHIRAALAQSCQTWQPVHLVRTGPGSAIGVAAAEAWTPLPGNRTFCAAHRLRFPYVVGETANAIATTAMVIAIARAGMLLARGVAHPGLGVRRSHARSRARESGGLSPPARRTSLRTATHHES